jgi:hypothetical protein
MSSLSWRTVDAVPLVHGRMAFAVEVRRRLLAQRYAAIAVELPPSVRAAMMDAVSRLPVVSVVLYREVPEFLDPADRHLWYVPADPCDGVVEALRIAEGERTPVHFVDAEVPGYRPAPLTLPDAHAVHGLGLEAWYAAVLPLVVLHARNPEY